MYKYPVKYAYSIEELTHDDAGNYFLMGELLNFSCYIVVEDSRKTYFFRYNMLFDSQIKCCRESIVK